MKYLGLLPYIGIGIMAVVIMVLMLSDWIRKRRLTTSLARRIQLNDAEFGRSFYPEPKRADIAIRVRRVLSKNLKMPLGGLTPGDRLKEDLNVELALNPDLFWELEAEFGVKTGADELETFEQTLERLVTFQDLVELIETRIAQPLPEPKKDESDKSSRMYDLAIRSIPILCVTGFLTVVAGIIAQKDLVMKLGTILFLSGFAVWGFANGGEMLRSMFRSLRGTPIKEIARRPFPLILMTCVALLLLWVGYLMVWAIMKNLSAK